MEYSNSTLVYDMRQVPGYHYNQIGNRNSSMPYSMVRQNQHTMAPASIVPTSMASSTQLFNVAQPVWYPMDQSLLYPQPRTVFVQPPISQDWSQDQPAQTLSTAYPQEPQQSTSRRTSSEPEPQLEKNRKCRWCERTFAHESSKCRHEKEHFNAFPCPKEGCRVVSSRKDSLKRHLRLMHGVSSRKSPSIGTTRGRRSVSK